MQSIWKEEFKVRINEVGFDGKIKLNALFNYLQEVATNHANAIGIGKDNLGRKNYYWILSRVSVEIYDNLRFGDELKVVTWPKGIDKLYAIRDYEIYKSTGELIANGTSSWIILDAETYKPQRPKVMGDQYKTVPMSAIKEPAIKIKPEKEGEVRYQLTASYEHLDVNNHVNNAVYINWICNALNERFFRVNVIKKITINYISEVKWGQKITIRNKVIDKDKIYVDGIEATSGKAVFTSIIQYENLIEKLRQDPKKNQNMINFVNDYKILKSEIVGKSILIQGYSDEPWVYIQSEDPEEFTTLIDKYTTNDLFFANLAPWMKAILLKQGALDWELSCDLLTLDREIAIPEIELPKELVDEGFELRALSEADVTYIFDNSKYNDFTSPDYIKHRIEVGIGFGIYRDAKLVAWILTHDDGAIGFLNVLENYRNLGMGQLLTYKTIDAVRKSGQTPFVCIEGDNIKSMNLSKKIGFKKNRRISWVKLK